MPSQIESSGDGGCNLEWLSPIGDLFEADIFQRYFAITSVDETSGWYGGALLYDQDENSEAYKHYAALSQNLRWSFSKMTLKKKSINHVLWMGLDGSDDGRVEAEMEAILKENEQIGSDLGIMTNCRSLAYDPSTLTRWMIGEHKAQVKST